jgi:1,2-diacylglycerol 3-alpha-glucosyltransferase
MVSSFMERLRIAMVAACPFPTSQGTQVFIGQLAEALRQRGHQVHLVAYHFGDKNLPVSAPIHRTWRLPFSGKLTSGPSLRRPVFDMLLAGTLDQVVRHKRVHLIHAHNYEGALAGLAIRRLRKVPVIFHTHNTMAHELPTYSRSRCGRWTAAWLGRLLDEQVPRRADACIAVTPDIVTYLQRLGAAPERIWAIPPAMQAGQFEMDRRISPGEKKDPWRLLYTGNLDGYQNLNLLLNSLKELTAGGHQCLLEVVTNSSSIHVEKQARSMGLGKHVRFTQTTSFRVVRELLTNCDVALCPRI